MVLIPLVVIVKYGEEGNKNQSFVHYCFPSMNQVNGVDLASAFQS